MSTQQAEDILKHTFKQLEKMLDDVRRQPDHSAQERKPIRKNASAGPVKKKNDRSQ